MLGFKVIFKFSNSPKHMFKDKTFLVEGHQTNKTLCIVPLPIIIDECECGRFPLQSEPGHTQLTSALNVEDSTFVTKTLKNHI